MFYFVYPTTPICTILPVATVSEKTVATVLWSMKKEIQKKNKKSNTSILSSKINQYQQIETLFMLNTRVFLLTRQEKF